jgi:hypothetical protein
VVRRARTIVVEKITAFPPSYAVKQPLDRPAGVGWW